ncbi:MULTISPECIES: AAA family ATPase [unclassified Novosphingobium]|uniref:AAA family ATPase n=1 Tax=unclassified Novosphingobium TaxID=2644732 RepID=UPI000F7F5861|nr:MULTISPECIES: AAA family ATPase [unclassified Novosphingobium]
MARKRSTTSLPPPYLKRIWFAEDGRADLDWEAYPFSLPLFGKGEFAFSFSAAVTIFVGENGAGKSTLLEAIAGLAGFKDGGGGPGMAAVSGSEVSGQDAGEVGNALRGAWLPQIRDGWFFRAETFFSVARYLDDAGSLYADFLSSSHGEGFLQFFEERLDRQGLFIFDEPESALSPYKQFEFLKILRRMQRNANAQVIIATHSPLLMALPDADLQFVDAYGLRPISLEETPHFQIYREFAAYPHETVEAMIE